MTAQDMSQLDIRDRTDRAVAIAREAGDLTMGFYQSDRLETLGKTDGSPVTVADREAEALMRRRLQRYFPDDAIVGEEHGPVSGQSGITWHLDPIDGTEVFVRGVPLFGTLIAATADGRALVGVAYFPALSELCFAGRGGGAFWAQRVPRFEEQQAVPPKFCRRVAVSNENQADRARLNSTGCEWWEKTGRTVEYRTLRERFGPHRTWGHCYGWSLVATGRAELFAEPSGESWDFAAAGVILEEAGGKWSSFLGRQSYSDGSLLVANNSTLHEEALSICSGNLGTGGGTTTA